MKATKRLTIPGDWLHEEKELFIMLKAMLVSDKVKLVQIVAYEGSDDWIKNNKLDKGPWHASSAFRIVLELERNKRG